MADPTAFAATVTSPSDLTPRDVERFWGSFEKLGADRCWQWLACVDRHGYGRFYVSRPRRQGRASTGAHRAAYVLLRGSIPQGMVVDHLCRNRACVNPAHLEVVSNAVNIRRGDVTGPRAVCRKGHPLTDPAMVYVNTRGERLCRICHRQYVKKWRAARRLALKADGRAA